MRTHKQLPVAAAVLAAAAAAAGALGVTSASAASHVHAKDKVKAKVHKGTLTVTGTNESESIALRLRAGDPSVLELVVDGQSTDAFKRSDFDHVDVDAAGGDDTVAIDESNGAFTDTEATTLEGGAGDDTLRGGSFAETLDGGAGNDFVDGNRGSDTSLLGAGDDTFQWDPGDGSDVVEGQDGKDTMQFNGANIAERFDLSANGTRLRFTRDIASIVMDNAGVEIVNVRALGGADTLTVHDLTGTDVASVNADLAATGGGGDGAADQVIVDGTAAADQVQVAGDSTRTTFSGLPVAVDVSGSEAADTFAANGLGGNDRFTTAAAVAAPLTVAFDGGDGADSATVQDSDAADSIQIAAATPAVAVAGGGAGSLRVVAESLLVNGHGGDDTINAGNGLNGLTTLTIDGGDGNDTIGGGDGNDTLIGGAGNDFVDGNRGSDTAQLGAGDDTFQWDPGDGSDVVEGQDGSDTMVFNGANIAEHFDLSANGTRLRFTRDIASIVMDTAGVETVDIRALGGADTLTVHNLSGTDVTSVKAHLAATGGGGDGAADSVVVEGTGADDVINAAGSAGSATVSGLRTAVSIDGAEAANDRVEIHALAGNDVVTASGLAADAIQLTVDAGEGDDVVTGGAGDDTLLGGPGDDVLIGGPGNDTLDGGPGGNILIQ